MTPSVSDQNLISPATLVVRGCKLVNVHSREVYETDITIGGDRIVSTERRPPVPGVPEIDATNLFAVPGLVDAHMHVDTTLLWPGELARVLVPLGTTTVFVDSVNVAHTGGRPAVATLRRAFDGLPLRGYVSAPSYCPIDPSLETAAAEIRAGDIAALLDEGCIAIGETVWSRIALDDVDYIRGVQTCRLAGLRVSGHGGEIRRGDEAAFDGYVTAGLQDDHCIGRGEDMLPRLRRGLKLFLVECTGRRGQLKGLLTETLARGIPTRQLCLCIDNITVMDIVGQGYGYLDYPVRIALDMGVPVAEAFAMASLNPAEHFRMAHDIGVIAPGRLADILLLRAPDAFPPHTVIVGGRVVARDGAMVVDTPSPNFPDGMMHSIDIAKVDPSRFVVRTESNEPRVTCRVIDVRDGDAFNDESRAPLPVKDGAVLPDPGQDALKLVVVERYGRNGNVGVGFARGFGLRRGAMATSVSIPSNNIAAIGVDDEDIWLAVRRLRDIDGGFVVVEDGKIVAEVSLPISGVMAVAPYERVLADIDVAEGAAKRLGCTLANPLFTLAQTVLSTLPDLGLTDVGLVNSRTGKIVPVVVAEAEG